MDVVLHRAQRFYRLFPPWGAGARNFSTGVFANRSNNVKEKKEKDTSLAYVSENIFPYVKLNNGLQTFQTNMRPLVPVSILPKSLLFELLSMGLKARYVF